MPSSRETHVQSLHFPVDAFTRAQAEHWTRHYGYRTFRVDRVKNWWHVRVAEPIRFVRGSYRSILWPATKEHSEIEAVIGHLKVNRRGERLYDTNGRKILEAWPAKRKNAAKRGPLRGNPTPSPADIADARREYRKTHWGEGGPEDGVLTLQMAAPGQEVFVIMGELTHVVYETSKGHEGVVPWEHEFGPDRPLLVYGRTSKRLGIAGGGYTVTRAGIKN